MFKKFFVVCFCCFFCFVFSFYVSAVDVSLFSDSGLVISFSLDKTTVKVGEPVLMTTKIRSGSGKPDYTFTFKADDTVLNETVSSGLTSSYTWIPAKAGTYYLKGIVVDADGVQSYSVKSVKVIDEVPSESVSEVPSEAVSEVPSEVVSEVSSESMSEVPSEVVSEVSSDTSNRFTHVILFFLVQLFFLFILLFISFY